MSPLKRKNVKGSNMKAKKIRTASFNSHQAINFNAKYLRTCHSNIQPNHYNNEPPNDLSSESGSRNHANNHSHKLKSFDLVEHVFGSLVSIKVAAAVLLAFLQLDLVKVRSQNDDLPHPLSTEDQIDACIHAAVALHDRLYLPKKSSSIDNRYYWEWSSHLATETGAGATMFLNTIALIAHHVISSVSLSGLVNTPVKTLWTTTSNPDEPSVRQCECGQTHSSSFYDCDDEQDSDPLPTIVALPIEAFTTSGGSENPSNNVEQSSIFSKLEPILRDGTSASSDDSSSITHYKKRYRRPSIYSTLLSIFTDLPFDTPPTSTGTSSSMTSSTDQFEDHLGVEGLRTFLQSQTGPFSLRLQDFSHLQQDQVKPEFMCFEGFAASGKVEDTQDSLSSYVSRVLPYMQQQHLSQPHSQFALGLSIMENVVTFCRCDSMGTEECTFDLNTGSGVLEIIRLALGFAVADSQTLGHDPSFELEKASGHTLVGIRGDMNEKGLDNAGVAFVPKYYNTPPDNTGRSYRYYLHYLVDNRVSFGRRTTRVWCAYRQVETEEEIAELVHPDDQSEIQKILFRKEDGIFVGPYALKHQNVDTSSIKSMENVIARIVKTVKEERKVTKENEITGVECILLPKGIYKGAYVSHVRGITEERGIPEAFPKLAPKQTIVTVSLFKRTLSQYKEFKEVAHALVDGLRAIHWLHQKGILHRDISDGNILLSQESPTTFTMPFSPESKIVLCRRKVSSPKGIFGVLHDFDFAGLVHVPENPNTIVMSKRKKSKSQSQTLNMNQDYPTHCAGQIGTLPYMSIRVLQKLTNFHTVGCDVESLFYVLYLFPFSNEDPQPISYPHRIPNAKDIGVPEWPEVIKLWSTRGINTTLDLLGTYKNDFFTNMNGKYIDIQLMSGENFKNNWKEGGKARILWEDLVNILHDEYIFSPLVEDQNSLLQRSDAIETSIPIMIKRLAKIIGEC